MRYYLFICYCMTLVLTNAQSDCARMTRFGEVSLSLPSIEGYEEAYTDPTVKQLADMTEVPANSVLGFYLNDATYARIDELGSIRFDDYFKVYGTNQIKDYPADETFLKEMQSVLSGNFISRNWEEMKKEIDKVGLDVAIGTPTVIDSYNLGRNSFTMVLLARYELAGEEPYTMVMSVNGLLMKNRLFWMAYYLEYTDEAVIETLTKNANLIVRHLLDENGVIGQ